MKKLISNEFRTSSMSDPKVEAEANEACRLGLDPLELLILLEEQEDGYVDCEIRCFLTLRRK